MKSLAVSLLILSLTLSVYSLNITDYENLMRDLMNGYNKHIRPVIDQRRVLQVNISCKIGSIQEFNEVKGTLTAFGVFWISWKDEKLAWKPQKYNLLTHIPIPSDWVWKPELLLKNPSEVVTSLETDWTSLRFAYNGLAVWVPSNVFTVSCSVNIKYYPFDTQTCFLQFSVNAYISWEVALNPIIDELQEEEYTENGEWDLVKTEIVQNKSRLVSAFKIKLVLARRPIFVFVNMIIPILFLSLLNTMVFFLPVESGERMSFIITIVLALAVFLTIIGDNIPKTSAPFPVLCYFIATQVALSSLVCIVTILNLRLYYNDDKKPVSYLIYKLMCKHAPTKCSIPATTGPLSISSADELTRTTAEYKCVNGSKVQYPKLPENSVLSWKDVSRFVDRIMIVFCVICLATACIVYTIIIITSATNTDTDKGNY